MSHAGLTAAACLLVIMQTNSQNTDDCNSKLPKSQDAVAMMGKQLEVTITEANHEKRTLTLSEKAAHAYK